VAIVENRNFIKVTEHKTVGISIIQIRPSKNRNYVLISNFAADCKDARSGNCSKRQSN
jgi:hypothetical protein